jgi:hypothetical protein
VTIEKKPAIVENVARWSPRDWRAMIALWASIVGAAVLTGFSAWLITLVVEAAASDAKLRARALEALATSNYGLLLVIGAILLSLGLAINRRSLKASAFWALIEAGGGEEPQP